MTYQVPQYFEPNAVKGVCSVCGTPVRWPMDVVRGDDGLWRCKRFCGPEETRIGRDRTMAASRRRRELPNPPNVVPIRYVSDYSAEEGEVFEFVCRVAPYAYETATGSGEISSETSVIAASEAVRYLHGLIIEGLRPGEWLTQARAKALALGDWLLARPKGGWAAGILRPPTLAAFVEDNAEAGIALLRCYQFTGDQKYLNGARSAALFLSRMQASGQANAATWAFTSSDAGGLVRLDCGAMATGTEMVGGVPSFIQVFRAGDLIALEFLSLLLSIEGDQTYGDAAGALFVVDTYQLTSALIARLRAYWLAAPGFATATPAEYFSSYPTGSGAWAYVAGDPRVTSATAVLSRTWALALRSLHAVDGMTSDVTSRYAWLMSAGSAAAFEVPSSYSPKQIADCELGTHVPALCLAHALETVPGPAPVNASSFLAFATAGLLAPLLAASDGAALDAFKTASALRLRYPAEWTEPGQIYTDSLFLRAGCGLSLQLGGDDSPSGSSGLRRDLYTAAVCGQVFRLGPHIAPAVIR